MKAETNSAPFASDIDAVLIKNQDSIKDYGYATLPLTFMQYVQDDYTDYDAHWTYFSDLSKSYESYQNFYGVQPSTLLECKSLIENQDLDT